MHVATHIQTTKRICTHRQHTRISIPPFVVVAFLSAAASSSSVFGSRFSVCFLLLFQPCATKFEFVLAFSFSVANRSAAGVRCWRRRRCPPACHPLCASGAASALVMPLCTWAALFTAARSSHRYAPRRTHTHTRASGTQVLPAREREKEQERKQ